MTIIVGVATPEGLILAGDSRTTRVDDQGRHRIASDHAQKIFTVQGMGVATFGAAFLGESTVAGLMDQFVATLDEEEPLEVEDFAVAIGEFFNDRFQQLLDDAGETWDVDAQGWPMGHMVAGYDSDGVGRIMTVMIPGPDIDAEMVPTTYTGGMLWQGQIDVADRLMHGVDWRGIEAAGIAIPDDVADELKKLAYVQLPPITLQDGVDYSAFLVRTTIDMQRFSDGTEIGDTGVPGCGGPIQILAIERSQVTWVRELSLTGPSQPGSAEGAAPPR